MEQAKIDFDYDDRLPKLALELALMLTPYLAPGTPRETAKELALRLAKLASKRMDEQGEPAELIRCHTCDALTKPDERARVAVCVRCALAGGSPGRDG